ncbi:hypothetical protein JCM31271_36400 [Halorubrum trueperi]
MFASATTVPVSNIRVVNSVTGEKISPARRHGQGSDPGEDPGDPDHGSARFIRVVDWVVRWYHLEVLPAKGFDWRLAIGVLQTRKMTNKRPRRDNPVGLG